MDLLKLHKIQDSSVEALAMLKTQAEQVEGLTARINGDFLEVYKNKALVAIVSEVEGDVMADLRELKVYKDLSLHMPAHYMYKGEEYPPADRKQPIKKKFKEKAPFRITGVEFNKKYSPDALLKNAKGSPEILDYLIGFNKYLQRQGITELNSQEYYRRYKEWTPKQ